MRLFLAGLICLCLPGVVGISQSTGASLDGPIVVTQIPVDGISDHPSAASLGRTWGQGARLQIVYPDGTKRRLAESFHSVCDPDVSFDGKRLLLAGKKTAQDPWNIYEIDLDGSELRQITREIGDCRSPSYQSAFYQISDANEAWHQITFLASQPDRLTETGPAAATALYSCRLDGTAVQRLTFNLSSDYDPHLMWDGRLVYASWQRRTLEHGLMGRVVLLEANLDGTDPAPLCVDFGRRIKHMPCGTTGGLIVFVETDQPTWDGAGMLSSVTTRRPLHTYQSITSTADGLFHSPSPLPDGRVLVSWRPSDGSRTHAVYRFDPRSKQMEPVLDDPNFHDIQAKLVAPRPEPHGRSSPSIDTDPHGKIYCLNVYTTDFDDKTWLAPGSVKNLRLIEGVAPRPAGPPSAGSDGVLPSLAPRRILGEVPLAADGSFNLEVPANTPFELQLVDQDGLALRSCGWIWTRNHFNQGCIGCHEDPELTPENLMVEALRSPSVVVDPPVEQRRSIDFRRDIAPIVTEKCLPCHSQGGSPPDLTAGRKAPVSPGAPDAARIAYEALLEPGSTSTLTRPAPGDWSGNVRGKYVDPGRATTSPLVWHLLGRNTSRPWDGQSAQGIPKPIQPAAGQALTPGELQALIEWIDLGAQWSTGPDR